MKTITIQIGNSDDKLTQKEWATFCSRVNDAVVEFAQDTHFSGYSQGSQPWQNACWVCSVLDETSEGFKARLVEIRASHNQDSIAWTEGHTIFA